MIIPNNNTGIPPSPSYNSYSAGITVIQTPAILAVTFVIIVTCYLVHYNSYVHHTELYIRSNRPVLRHMDNALQAQP